MEEMDLCEALILGVEPAQKVELSTNTKAVESVILYGINCASYSCMKSGEDSLESERTEEQRQGSSAGGPRLSDTSRVKTNPTAGVEQDGSPAGADISPGPGNQTETTDISEVLTDSRDDGHNLSLEAPSTRSELLAKMYSASDSDWSLGDSRIGAGTRCGGRPVFTQQLPKQVFHSSQTFGGGCTRGCAWSPAGDRLAAAGEDARYDSSYPPTRHAYLQEIFLLKSCVTDPN